MAVSPVALSIVFWLSLMCAGNVWGYVPIRALTTHADIAISAKGFAVSPWVQFPFLVIPALFMVYHFFSRMCAGCFATMTGGSPEKLAFVVALTSYWFFAFYGGDGTSGDYGPVTQFLAITSKYFLFPIAVMWLWARYSALVELRGITPRRGTRPPAPKDQRTTSAYSLAGQRDRPARDADPRLAL